MMQWLIQQFGRLLDPAAQRFHKALDDPEAAQRSVQQQICDRLVASDYGKKLNIRSVQDWQQVPIVEYDEIAPWLPPPSSRFPIASPLTLEPILFYEKTSGSRGPAKWIPYTRSLRRSFNHLFCVWARDLIQFGPRFSTGQLYFCISPKLAEAAEDPAVLQDDSAYLDPWLRWILRPFWVAPSGLHQLRDPNLFKHQLCLALLRSARLEIISIWSPSFLKVHLDYIQTHRQQLAQELQGRITLDRLQLLAEPMIPWTQLWPDLKLISCWDSVQAADQATGLRSLFPNVLVQGKGLLATEAPLTIPLIAAQGCVPVLDQVFFEFEDGAGQIHLLHELQIGREYTIVLSQMGGLYRYRIGDRVRVSHFYRQTPCLEFLGRNQTVSDLVGEKLQADFVRDGLDSLNLTETCFKSLVPVTQPQAGYVLLLDAADQAPSAIAQQLDRVLCRSPQYQHARLLGQLAPLRVLVSHHIPEQLTLYRARSGCTWGDIKHPILATAPVEAEFIKALEEMSQP